MAQEFIGVIVAVLSGEPIAVINPDDDAELDNPKLLLFQGGRKEPLAMVKVPRGDYTNALSMADVAEIATRIRRKE